MQEIPKGQRNGTWSNVAIKKRALAAETQKCANCGKDFKHPHQYYCSDKCADEFFYANHGGIWSSFRNKVIERDKGKCVLCGNDGNEVDHIVELDRGGTNRLDNLRTLCHGCHRKKTRSYVRRKASLRKQIGGLVLLNPDRYLAEPLKQKNLMEFIVA